jgi:porin
MRNRIRHTLRGLVLLVAAGTARAGAPQPFSEDLFLDWYGFREALRQEGIDLRVGYVSETATNAQGGERRLVSYTDQWTFMGTLDLNTLFSDPDAILRITITDRNGRNLSGDAHLDSLQQVQELYGRGQTCALPSSGTTNSTWAAHSTGRSAASPTARISQPSRAIS